MKSGRKLKRPEKLNLVPILDSVFIFIFFLLMSAQFLDIYEIGSSLPMTQELNEPTDKDPLNLTLEITKERVTVKSGTKKEARRTFAATDKEKLREYLTKLKKKHPKENTMIVKADPKVSFQSLIKVMDNARAPAGSKEKLFEQVVFDNQGSVK